MSIRGNTVLNSTQNEKFFKKFVGKIKTHTFFSVMSSENHAVYDIRWKNMVE
jgi:hypothetical protein